MLRTYHLHGQLAHLALLHLLFRAHFEHARDIGDVDVLAEVGVKAVMVKVRMEGRRVREAIGGGAAGAAGGENGEETGEQGEEGLADLVVPTLEDIDFVSPISTSTSSPPSPPPSFDPSALSPSLQAIHADTLAFLRSTELEAEVKEQSGQAAKKGITGVPFSVIERRWAVSGCQKPECYYKVGLVFGVLCFVFLLYKSFNVLLQQIFEKLGSMDEAALQACSALKSQPPLAPTQQNGHGHAHGHGAHHHIHQGQPAAATAAVS
jgi:hypothetical protein